LQINLVRLQIPLHNSVKQPHAAFLQQAQEQQHNTINSKPMPAMAMNPNETAFLKLSGLSKSKSKSV